MKRVLVSCLIAAMFTGLVACGDNASSENTTGAESSVTADSGADVESQADSGEEDKAKDNISGVHYDKDAEVPSYDNVTKSYSDIPDGVKKELQEYSLDVIQEYLDKTDKTYEINEDLKYEGYIFQYIDHENDPDENYLFYVYSSKGSRMDSYATEKTEGALCFYARYENVIQLDDNTFSTMAEDGNEHWDTYPRFEYDAEKLMTHMYLCEVDVSIPSYTTEAGDGFEKYGNYKALTKVADLEKDPFFDTMKEVAVSTIDAYMEKDMEDNIKYTEPEYYGAYIMTRDDIHEYSESYLVFKSVISDTEGLINDTEVLFTIEFSATRYTENGELTFGSASTDPVGQSELGDSAYVIRAYEKVEDMYHLREASQTLDRIIDRSEVLNY